MKEVEVVQRYGKQSKQYLQYMAIIQESELIHRHGEFSKEVREFHKYMRKLGIPVV